MYDNFSSPQTGGTSNKPVTVRESMQYRLDQAKANLKAVERAIEILDKHPDIEELLNIMRNVGF